jgi:hypothetical protein
MVLLHDVLAQLRQRDGLPVTIFKLHFGGFEGYRQVDRVEWGRQACVGGFSPEQQASIWQPSKAGAATGAAKLGAVL